MTRKNASLTPIAKNTLKRYLMRMIESVKARVAEEIPATFGIVLDGSFCPLEVEEDLGAQSLFDLIADTLSRYNKPWEAVHFMVADNCSVNQYIGSREGGLPMVGCASHRFNLAVTDYLTSYEALLSKIHALMTKLRTIKGRAILRRVTDLSPLHRYDTRWSSTYAIVQRYTKLKPALNSLGHGTLVECGIQTLLLQKTESECAHEILEVLADFEGVTKTLQRSTLTLSGRKEQLSAAERADFRRTGRDVTEETSPTQAAQLSLVQQAFKKRKVSKRSLYADVAFIPPTSNECERFFSSVKLVYSDLRKRLDVSTLEVLMFLMYNSDLWDVYTIESARL
ncbi:hypothetical protein L914_18230 [Phytophthora nicotianae]|uniref:HAT C-terminal dimerisation domain-containing protein n=1 Tax=Phytophthora nicotianae TaxID=4792 RepID=W2MEJ4_PHYNI|nr:hypothetical protein L914_18230 [Phytophthora nicotianae]